MGKSLSNKAWGIGLAASVILGSIGSGMYLHRQGNLTKSVKAIAAADSRDDQRAILASATNLIEQKQGQLALQQLTNLEQDYPLLAPYVILKQGEAYQVVGDTKRATQTWLKLLQQYPDSPAVAEALYLLGQENQDYDQKQKC